LVEGHHDLLAHGSLEGLGTCREHIGDALGVVPLVRGDEGDGIADCDIGERRLENHRALGSLVEHLDLVVGGQSRAGNEAENGNCQL